MLKKEIEDKHIQSKNINGRNLLGYDFDGFFSGIVFLANQNIPDQFYPFSYLSDAIYGNFGDNANLIAMQDSKKKWSPF